MLFELSLSTYNCKIDWRLPLKFIHSRLGWFSSSAESQTSKINRSCQYPTFETICRIDREDRTNFSKLHFTGIRDAKTHKFFQISALRHRTRRGSRWQRSDRSTSATWSMSSGMDLSSWRTLETHQRHTPEASCTGLCMEQSVIIWCSLYCANEHIVCLTVKYSGKWL